MWGSWDISAVDIENFMVEFQYFIAIILSPFILENKIQPYKLDVLNWTFFISVLFGSLFVTDNGLIQTLFQGMIILIFEFRDCHQN